ncbi:MAG TPA: hypothetical protein VGR41_01205 [Actinomycetota bacterium]|jgi:hypothetical protein|nr:hypothetical protein [Actinomycetota bacterium]
MRRIALLAIAGLAMLGLVAGPTTAGSTENEPGRTLRLVQGAPQVALVDLGNPGPTAGDQLVLRSDLFDRSNTKQVGDLNIVCSQTIGPENLCRGIFTLFDRGRISVDALPVLPEPTVGTVNGGTGEFQTFGGEVHIDPEADGTTKITFHLFD